MNKYHKLLKRIESGSSVTFVLAIAFLSILVKIPGSILGDFLVKSIGLGQAPYLSDQQIMKIDIFHIITAILIAPPIETFLGQALPIKIISKFSNSKRVQIIASALVFSLSHLPVLGFLFGAFFVGIVLSWGYIVKSKESKTKAFWLITLSHSIHNLIAFLILLFFIK